MKYVFTKHKKKIKNVNQKQKLDDQFIDGQKSKLQLIYYQYILFCLDYDLLLKHQIFK